MGLWHDMDGIVRAAERLRDDPRVAFVLIGDGIRRASAQRLARKLALTKVLWRDFVPAERLAESLSGCHAALISLRKGLHGITVPSKLYGIMAAGRPLLAQVPPGSEIAMTVDERRCGLVAPPGDVDGLASAIRHLVDRPGLAHMGGNAFSFYRSRYTVEHAVRTSTELWGSKRVIARAGTTIGTNSKLTLVTGSGGFIGGHLVRRLLDEGAHVRAVDAKPFEHWNQLHPGAENLQLDLRLPEACQRVVRDAEDVYNLASDMGGMGFIENNKALCMLSVLINTHLLQASTEAGVGRYFYSSSACVYAADKQQVADLHPLKEADAYPAMPEDGYGWEKLFSERMCRHFHEDFPLVTRVARYHNVYGPYGTYDGGREKAPAAICRKVASAALTGKHEIEIWGDGNQTRSFTYIDDCLFGTTAIMHSDIDEPINLGSSEMVTINELVDIVEEIAGIQVERRYVLDAPLGVRGRNSDNSLILERLGWEPRTSLADGLEVTYRWIHDELAARAPA
jgi:GDP-D-mannose 3', 5'-epimerase